MEEDTDDADKPTESTPTLNPGAIDDDDREVIDILNSNTEEFKEEILILDTDELPELDTITVYPPSPSPSIPEYQDNPGLLPDQQETPPRAAEHHGTSSRGADQLPPSHQVRKQSCQSHRRRHHRVSPRGARQPGTSRCKDDDALGGQRDGPRPVEPVFISMAQTSRTT